MAVYYTEVDKISDETLTIGGQEAHHICNVMRLKKGEVIRVVDGTGTCYRTEINNYVNGNLTCNILSLTRNFGETSNSVTLAAGISAGSKFDEVIQKGVELGISRFVPLITEKSKINLDDPDRLKTRQARWKKIAIASMKQCERSLLPEIELPSDYDSFVRQVKNSGRILLFDPAGDKTIYDLKLPEAESLLTLIIGPESGFSREEIVLARESRAEIITLGKRILRSENAAPTACALIMQLLGEFR